MVDNEIKSLSNTEMDEEFYVRMSHEDAEMHAKKMGYIVVYPDKHTLQIDIDSEQQYKIFKARRTDVTNWYSSFTLIEAPSLSGKPFRLHLTLTFSNTIEFTPADRIFLQLYLGSDPVREFLSLQALRVGDELPTLFFELPTKK